MKKGNHVSYRGTLIDMESIKSENEHVPAIGNMNVNARGDILGKGGVVAKTVDEVAREHHRTRTAIRYSGLKGKQPEGVIEEKKKATPASATGKPMAPRQKETEAPNKDIIVEDATE
jgi:hypothetical protein